MKRRYLPLNMVMNGRYAVLYGKLSPEEQQDVLSKMAELIEEEKEYEDKGNYGHLCNILTTIAIDEALQKNGKSDEEAFELISTHPDPLPGRAEVRLLLCPTPQGRSVEAFRVYLTAVTASQCLDLSR